LNLIVIPILFIPLIVAIVGIYRYLKTLFVWKKEGKPREFLIKEAFIRLGFLWVILALLHLSVVNDYNEKMERYFKCCFTCSSSIHVFKGKEHEVKVCEGVNYNQGYSREMRLNVFDGKKRLLLTRDFIDETIAYSEVGDFHIIYLEDRIEYGYDKNIIYFPVTWWDRATANLPIVSTMQFAISLINLNNMPL
jgi:hypothetical protein